MDTVIADLQRQARSLRPYSELPPERHPAQSERHHRMLQEAHRRVTAILTPQQRKRLHQLQLQHYAGIAAMALLEPDVAQALELTPAQRQKLEAVGEERERVLRAIRPSGPVPRDPEQKRQWLQKSDRVMTVQEEYNAKALAVLTPAQKAEWKEMLGPPAPLFLRIRRLQPGLLRSGSTAPDFTLKTPSGETVTLSELTRESAVLLNFWFIDCGFCRAEFPHLQRIEEEFGGKGLAVVTVNQGDSPEQVRRFLARRGLTFTTVLNEPGGPNDAVRAYEVQGFPATYLIGKDRKILKALRGFDPRHGEEALRRALAEIGFGKA